MDDDHIMEKWQMVAIEIGDGIYRKVNIPEFVGTRNETHYALLFFNGQNPDCKSTLVSSETDMARLRKVLQVALRSFDKAMIVERGSEH